MLKNTTKNNINQNKLGVNVLVAQMFRLWSSVCLFECLQVLKPQLSIL